MSGSAWLGITVLTTASRQCATILSFIYHKRTYLAPYRCSLPTIAYLPMGYLRPATPGFIVTFVATILLIIVSFCVPYLKSVFFLRASISQGGVNGSIIFGTLGYCLELSNGTLCSKPSVGYELGQFLLSIHATWYQISFSVIRRYQQPCRQRFTHSNSSSCG